MHETHFIFPNWIKLLSWWNSSWFLFGRRSSKLLKQPCDVKYLNWTGNTSDITEEQQPERILRKFAQQRHNPSGTRAASRRRDDARETRPGQLRQLSEQAADTVHPRRLLQRREQTHLRDGQVRPAGFHSLTHPDLNTIELEYTVSSVNIKWSQG